MSSVAIEPLASREAATGAVGPLVFLAVVAWTALVYLPFYGLDGPDDAFYVEAAHLWTKGAPPYVGAFDVKAPGFFAVLAAAQLAFGSFWLKAAFGEVISPDHVSHGMVDIADAAMAPARKTVRANARRLTGAK